MYSLIIITWKCQNELLNFLLFYFCSYNFFFITNVIKKINIKNITHKIHYFRCDLMSFSVSYCSEELIETILKRKSELQLQVNITVSEKQNKLKYLLYNNCCITLGTASSGEIPCWWQWNSFTLSEFKQCKLFIISFICILCYWYC